MTGFLFCVLFTVFTLRAKFLDWESCLSADDDAPHSSTFIFVFAASLIISVIVVKKSADCGRLESEYKDVPVNYRDFMARTPPDKLDPVEFSYDSSKCVNPVY